MPFEYSASNEAGWLIGRQNDKNGTVYIRFVTARQDPDSGFLEGIFQVAYAVRDSGTLESWEEWLERELTWLKIHLKSPDVLRDPGNRRAISWFHPRALRPIEKVRSIAALLEEKGEAVRMIKTRDTGIVIYEDGWQVVAKPRRRK